MIADGREPFRLTHLDVPRDYVSNMRWRAAVREWALLDVSHQIALRRWIYNDLRLFIAGFCWVFEPRDDRARGKQVSKTLPFIPWDHQEHALIKLNENLGYDDIGFDKSRGEGASWVVLTIFLHQWLTRPMTTFGLVSRNELAVDNPDDPDSLMWKLDWQLKKLPQWLVPNFDRNLSKHTLVNVDNGASIVGYSATGDVARGGRKTAFFMDEIASFNDGEDQAAMDSTGQVTNCRLLVSTPKGPFGVFYTAMNTTNNMVKISLRWQQNPLRKRGAYRIKNGRVELIDWEYWRERMHNPLTRESDVHKGAGLINDETTNNPFKYAFMLRGPFVREGRMRSPWYDTQCRRPGATPRSIAQELDLDYAGSSSTFFDINELCRLQSVTCREPLLVGDLLFNEFTEQLDVKLAPRPGGSLLLWCPLIPGTGRPPADRDYVIGADVASGLAGENSSNSTLCVTDARSREQVAEFARPDIKPEKLAWYAFALGHWFKGPNGPALIVPEVNGGYGKMFTKTLRELSYPAVYRRDVEDETGGARKVKDKYGWFSNKPRKKILFQEFEHALISGELQARSWACLEEAKGYIENTQGQLIHINALAHSDPSGASEAHGDRVVGLALSWRGVRESGLTSALAAEREKTAAELNRNSVGGRRSSSRNQASANRYVW